MCTPARSTLATTTSHSLDGFDEQGFCDKTFRKGLMVRCTIAVMICINWLLFVIGFATAVYGLRLGSQEFAQMEFLKVVPMAHDILFVSGVDGHLTLRGRVVQG